METTTLGQTIKKLRQEKNLTQQQLADLMNVSNKAISKWENDEGTPDLENLKRLSQIFKISLDQLLSNKKQEEKYQLNKKDKIIFTLSVVSVIMIFFPFASIRVDFGFETSAVFTNPALFVNGFQMIRSMLRQPTATDMVIGALLLGYLILFGLQTHKLFKSGLNYPKEPLLYALAALGCMIGVIICFITYRPLIGEVTLSYAPVIMAVLQVISIIVIFMPLKSLKDN